MIRDYLEKQAKQAALKTLIRETRYRQEQLKAYEGDLYFNLLNTGLTVNLKKTGDIVLNIIVKSLEKQISKTKKGGRIG
jgi:hypothetical protein